MSTTSSPTVASWELSIRLREHRVRLGMDVATVTKALKFSRNYWSAVENDRTMLADDKFATVLALFELDEAERKRLTALRDYAKSKPWWSADPSLVLPGEQRFFGLEDGSEAIRNFEGLVIPGPLQTEAYSRALFSSLPGVAQVEVESRVRFRRARQKRILDDTKKRLSAVISEGALLQHVSADPQVQHGQLCSLTEAIDTYAESVDLRILPFAQPLRGMVGTSSLVVFSFEQPILPSIAFQEAAVPIGFIEDPAEMHLVELTFKQAYESSLSRTDSQALIESYASALRSEIEQGDFPKPGEPLGPLNRSR
ncbi:MAG: Scr1 family TA system antitoxin-like transcriptional regulator [Actinomycetota bacterium]